jgi:predicted Fe-S protein YdhL (DUF1289 family)
MSDHLSFIPSPCIGVCTMEGDYCAGCYRTLQEISDWPGMTQDKKRSLMSILSERAKADQQGELNRRSVGSSDDEWE